MNRKDALSRIAFLLGGSIAGAEIFLSGCTNTPDKISRALNFSKENLVFLDEVGDTILPTTAASPGAKAVAIGAFMQTIVTDCYETKDQEIFMTVFNKIDTASSDKYGKKFLDLDAAQRHDLLVDIDKEAAAYQQNKKADEPPHYFTLVKQLTLWGYFTSKPGATQALRYLPVPGGYKGCVEYKKGDKAWAI